MLRSLLILSTFLLVHGNIQAQADLWSLKKDVGLLSSDLMAGRMTGEEGERMAARYIVERFQAIGVKPAGTEGYFQTFTFRLPAHPHDTTGSGAQVTATNVVGLIDNGAPTTVVIGAHYDHIGEGKHGSRHTGEPAIHNGADDNASGVAALLYVAEKLASKGPKGNNYLFIGFSGEELGLFGSKHFADQPTIPLASINYMLNMDMVGRLDTTLVVNGYGTSPAWKAALDKASKSGFSIVTSESGIGPSDHTSFYLKGIPAIHFFTGQHADYHKPQDDAHLVNYEGLQKVSDLIVEVVGALDGDGRIAFTKTKDESANRSRGFKVTMGVMPDYTFGGAGMRIDGVIDGRPAQQAGLLQGDVIVRIGDTPVASVQDYMGALGSFEKGQSAKVKVLRKDAEVEVEVRF